MFDHMTLVDWLFVVAGLAGLVISVWGLAFIVAQERRAARQNADLWRKAMIADRAPVDPETAVRR